MSEQNALNLIWPSSYDAKHYIVAECNELVWQAIQNPSEWRNPVLLVMGEASSGKTYLTKLFNNLHGADDVKDLHTIQKALHHKNARSFDDIDQFITAYPEAIEDVFHLVNASMTDKTPLLLTTSRPPQEWVTLPDLLSRLQAANHITLDEPNDEMIKGAYHKLFSDRGILVGQKVLDYLTLRSERSFAGIRNIVDILDKASLEQGRKITIPMIQGIDIFK